MFQEVSNLQIESKPNFDDAKPSQTWRSQQTDSPSAEIATLQVSLIRSSHFRVGRYPTMRLLARALLWLCAAVFVAVYVAAEEKVPVKSVGNCADLKTVNDLPIRSNVGCYVENKNYEKAAGKFDSVRRELEQLYYENEHEKLETMLKDEDKKMREELKSDFFKSIGMITIIGFAASSFFGLVTLFFNWFNLFWATARVRRRLCSLNEKMVIVEKMLARRRFADDHIEKLSKQAAFDANLNEEEITKKLNSVYGEPGPTIGKA
ncbi:hypothetical protein QR680_005877 [Steinernema hermaphroditum]|uniref:Uncharacterized protein n=1 Tax=Steinernema hermaphroditum TaxID=289476 RepID=A0AA39HTL4_9BILA|nr:hypothetical protein QR680_005877 [Steinernema hermaphroditum]